MRNWLIISSLFILVFSCKHNQMKTPLEKSGFTSLSTNQEIINFLADIKQRSKSITCKIIDTTEEGRYIPLVKLSDNTNSNKPAILLLGQQHGNEPSGKEGLLLLIKEFALKQDIEYTKQFDVFILPQVNPDGGDKNERRNSQNIDLNRDHLILKSLEAKVIQNVFDTLKPIVTVDFHEYYPFSDEWTNFGFRKNFDIQLGGLTNINVDDQIRNYFYKKIFSGVKNFVEQDGYTFFEYTLGNYALNERLRHSTVDINDGRQSFGICNTMSFIVEGINGRDSIDHIERRAKSQYRTAKGILEMVSENFEEIEQIVKISRSTFFLEDSNEMVSIRMDHFKGKQELNYPLLSLKTGIDTIFKVNEYHPQVLSLLEVKVPKYYLIPQADTVLVNWLYRSNFNFSSYKITQSDQVFAYKIVDLSRSMDEELKNYYPKVLPVKIPVDRLTETYYAVPTSQLYKYKIVTALEPQAMYGLINYPEFEYLLFDDMFKILRIEY